MRKWSNEYGMALVLLLLCAFFTAMTWGEQQPEGSPAAQQLAGQLADARQVVIVTPKSVKAEAFSETLSEQLKRSNVEIVATLSGEPFEVLEQLDQLLAEGKSFDTLAVHPVAYHWTIFERRAQEHSVVAKATIVTPAPTRGSSFLSRSNLLNIANQIAVMAIIAIGMTMIIITGGIDLSVGSLLALSAVVTTWLIRHYGGKEAGEATLVLASLGGIASCAAMGTFSGFMVTRFRIPAFIVTLSVMLITRGIAERISENQSINDVPQSFEWLGIGRIIEGVPNAVVLMLVLYVIAHLVMTRTVFGRYIYAVGGNAKAAWLSGVPVNGVLMAVYIIGASLAGLAGVVIASQFRAGAPTYGFMYEMYVIAAVVVGGTSITGGEGRIVNTLIGALIIAVISNGMNLLGVQSDMQKVVLGAMILGAVLIDSLQRRSAK